MRTERSPRISAAEMKKILKISIFIFLALAAVCSASIYIFRSELIAHYAPEIEQVGEINIRVTNDTSFISSRITVLNRSFLSLQMDTLKYKVSLFEKTYLQNERSVGMKLKPGEKDTLDLSLKIPYTSLLKELKLQRKKGDSASYLVNVSLQYSTIFGRSVIPISKSARIKLPQPPEVEIVEIKCSRIRFRTIRAVATIRIINYSAVTVAISDLDYSMRITDHGNLKGRYSRLITIAPNATTYIYVPIEINVKNMGKTAFQVLMNKDQYDYTLTLHAILKSIQPFNRSFLIDLEKSGKMELKK
jgi:LEA14-like dessication related protein